jgi:hypothetical protein
MTTRDTWLALAACCETAEGPDRELDVAIGIAIDWQTEGTRALREVVPLYGGLTEFVAQCINSSFSIYSHDQHMPRWAGSLDAITALIGRELPGAQLTIRPTMDGLTRADLFGDAFRATGIAPTEALARCAAFLRAKAEGAPHE